MTEIDLQELIYQVKRELLAPNPMERAKDPYPLFFIDKIELEIFVSVKRTKNGTLKLTVLDFFEVGGNKAIEHERGHVVRVSLSPLQSRDQILNEALKDPRIREAILNRTGAWVKSQDDLLGPSE